MQADPAALGRYPKTLDSERGASRSALTGTDTASWREKSWVVGVAAGGASTAYDWNRLRRERVVHDVVGGTPVVLAVAADGASFFAFRRPDAGARPAALEPVTAYHEFWHGWRSFHPGARQAARR